MNRAAAGLLAAQAAAFWPVWIWYSQRVDGAGEAAAIALALAVAVGAPSTRSAPKQSKSLVPSALLTLAYAIGFSHSAPLIRALLAMAALGTSWIALSRPDAPVARFGLLLLATPALPSMQFFLGYPLRIVVTALSALWLKLAGIAVSAEGVGLTWEGGRVLVDAPCSGVRMLWGSAFLALASALFRRLSSRATAVLLAAAIGFCILGNSLRASALFFLETRFVDAPTATHEVVGVAVFAGVAAGILMFSRHLGAR